MLEAGDTYKLEPIVAGGRKHHHACLWGRGGGSCWAAALRMPSMRRSLSLQLLPVLLRAAEFYGDLQGASYFSVAVVPANFCTAGVTFADLQVGQLQLHMHPASCIAGPSGRHGTNNTPGSTPLRLAPACMAVQALPYSAAFVGRADACCPPRLPLCRASAPATLASARPPVGCCQWAT